MQVLFQDVGFKCATPDERTIIQSIARTTWHASYKNLLTPDQLEYMLDFIYRDESIIQQMMDGQQFIIGYHFNKPTGFSSIEKKYRSPTNLMIQ
jgi:hypothetical protein